MKYKTGLEFQQRTYILCLKNCEFYTSNTNQQIVTVFKRRLVRMMSVFTPSLINLQISEKKYDFHN
jgi:superfamily I DNA and RNA helicase